MSEKVSFKLPKGLKIFIAETCTECRKQNRFCGLYGKQKVCLRIVADSTSVNGVAIEMLPSCELGKHISVSETVKGFHIREVV